MFLFIIIQNKRKLFIYSFIFFIVFFTDIKYGLIARRDVDGIFLCHKNSAEKIEIDVEIPSAAGPAAQDDSSVRQFLTFCLIAVSNRKGICSSERFPGLPEIITVNHPVATWSGTKGEIDAVMGANLDLTALEDSSGCDETSAQRT